MGLGNAGNNNLARVVIQAKGETWWSVPIPGQERVSSIIVAEDGCVFVSSPDALTAVEQDGSVRWDRKLGQPFGDPIALADGSILLTEEEGGQRRLVARAQATGEELWSMRGDGWPPVRPAVAPSGAIVLKRYIRDARALDLQCVNPGGEVLWSYRLASLNYREVLALENLVVFSDGAYLTGLDGQGNLLWRANRHGFLRGAEAAAVGSALEHNSITTAPMLLDNSQIAAGCTWHDGHGMLIFNPSAGTVTSWPNVSARAMPFDPPVAVLPSPGPRLAGASLRTLLVFDVAGRIMLQAELPWEIRNIIGDPAGNLVVSTSVDSDYWEKYRDPYDLHLACSIAGFAPAGNQLFRWVAPGPMSGPLAVGKSGELYCVSEGKLWAIR